MRFLANENIPRAAVRLLRNRGHDVASISEDAVGSSDEQVLDRAVREQRVILTFDSDYGRLVYLDRLPAPPGIVYMRFVPRTPEEPALRLLRTLESGTLQLTGWFSVMSIADVRQRPLPD